MIDCENEVYTRIAEALRSDFPEINVSGEYANIPSAFPHVSFVQSDNKTVKGSTGIDKEMAEVMFEVNVYSNKKTGRKTECKQIIKKIDDVMFSMNFRRLSLTVVPNLENATIYRLVARYSAWTDGQYFYRS